MKTHLIVLIALLLTAGCAPQIIKNSPSKIRVDAPSKQVPSRNRIPYTQKPYKVMGRTYYPIPSSYGFAQTGIASWYGNKFHGKKTSNGETYNMYGQTAAHKTLPMNTELLVKNLENGREIVVRVNDRGPFVKGRIIDLTLTAARKLGMDQGGTARVRLTALGEAVKSTRGGREIERFLPYQDFSKGEFFVQIGAFADKKNADQLKGRLLNRGKKVVVQAYERDGKNYYRVQVRGGRTLSDAQQAERILESRFPGAFVIAR